MPPIDPRQLLDTLKVLLGNHGGIKSHEEVVRLVQLMGKFSKKMVSKVVYINILRSTRQDVLEKFLTEGGWSLINSWFSEGIKSMNWPLTKEILSLFLQCPMTINRLRENSDQNLAPKLVRQLTAYTEADPDLAKLAQQVLEKWMTVIQCPPQKPGLQGAPAPLPTRSRGQRATSTTPPPDTDTRSVAGNKVVVTVFTDTVEVLRLLDMQCNTVPQVEPEFWYGKDGKTAKILARRQKAKETAAAKAAARAAGGPPPPKRPKLVIKMPRPPQQLQDEETVVDAGAVPVPDKSDKDYTPPGQHSDDEDDEEDESDDDLAEIMARADRAVNRNRKFGRPQPPPATVNAAAVRKSVIVKNVVPTASVENSAVAKSVAARDAGAATAAPGSPLTTSDVQAKSVDSQSSMILHDEVMDVDDLLKDESSVPQTTVPEPQPPPKKVAGVVENSSLDVLKDLADGVAEDLKKEKEREREKEKQRVKVKDKENKKDKSSSDHHKKKDKHRDRDRDRDKDRDRDRDRDRAKDRDRDRDHERRRREREERRKREKEREKKEKIKREAKPFKETEMRNSLDSKEKEKIKEVVQRLKDESLAKKKESSSSSPNSTTTAIEKPKPIKKDIPTVDKSVKSSLSFDALMSSMDTKSKVKGPPIKNKNKDLLASFSSGSVSGPVHKKDPSKSSSSSLSDVFKMRTEDKSSKIIPASDFLKNKSLKRPAANGESEQPPKIKIKSPAQLTESNVFADVLSNIIKDDQQPKKKVIKIAELKQKTEEEERAKKMEEEKKEAQNKTDEDDPATTNSSGGGLSFYRDTLMDDSPVAESQNSPSDSQADGNGGGEQSPTEVPPEEQVPRDVRGQLVIARGTFRPRKRVSWPEETSLVKVKFFELDENERVNVNKLKFEEMRKKELELEKSALNNRNMLAVEESRPWPTLSFCDFTPPEIEYGGQSLEKVAQQKRENSVLQALYFNNLPSNPSEPENQVTVRFDTKDIPLEDKNQEETYNDYSDLGWPDPVPDLPSVQAHLAKSGGNNRAPQTEAIFERLQHKLQGIMGEPQEGEWMNQMPARPPKVASEMEMIKQGLIPPPNNLPMDQFGHHPGDQPMPPHMGEDGFGPGNEMYDPYMEENMMQQQQQHPGGGHHQGWPQGGGGPFPPQQQFGGGQHFPPSGGRSNWRGSGGGHRGFHPRGGGGGRGFHDNNRGGGGGRGFFRNNRGGGRGRVCKYWTDRGFCRDGDNCLWLHPPR